VLHGLSLAASAIANLREQWSDLEVEVGTEHTGDPVRALLRGKIDLALLTTSDLPKGRGLRQQRYYPTPLARSSLSFFSENSPKNSRATRAHCCRYPCTGALGLVSVGALARARQ